MKTDSFRSFAASPARLMQLLFILTLACVLLAPAHGQSRTLTDLRGRQVTINQPVKKISIDDGRYLVALALIHPKPVDVLAAWPRDIHRIGQHTYDQLLAQSPALKSVRQIASSAASFDLEAVLAAAPDVAVVSYGAGPTDAQVAQLQAAGIPVVFIDFFTHPFKNQARSLQLLGELIGRQQQASAFVKLRDDRLKIIAERVAKVDAKSYPSVFLEAHAGMSGDCCNSPGRGNVGDYISFVGGHNIGADVLRESFGKLNLEYVISSDPKIYIATGGPHLARARGLEMGEGYTPDQARAALKRMTERQGIAQLSAVKRGQVHGIAHQLLNSPLDILAIEVLAKWTHPQLFKDVDPQATLELINQQFLAVPYQGTFWVDLKPAK